jgi:hypothetical protein
MPFSILKHIHRKLFVGSRLLNASGTETEVGAEQNEKACC